MIRDSIKWMPVWTITRHRNEQDRENNVEYSIDEALKLFGISQISKIIGNCLLNEGITETLKLLAGISATAFSEAAAYIGVGDTASPAAAATQTGLQAPTNKLWKGMSASYPVVVNQTITFRAVFTGLEANYAWAEFTVVNGANDSGINLNRVVSAQGTKVSGQIWTVDLAITIS
jgi:hypothetical protein